MNKLESELYTIGKSDLVKSFAFGLLAMVAVFLSKVMDLYDPAIEAMKSGHVPVFPVTSDLRMAALVAIGTGLATLKLFLVHKFLSDENGTPKYLPFIGSIGKLIGSAKQAVADGKAVVADVQNGDMVTAVADAAKVADDVKAASDELKVAETAPTGGAQ